MTLLFYTSLVCTLVGIAIQIYAFSTCILTATDDSNIRYVPGNELSLTWASTAGLLASWCTIHMLFWSNRNPDKATKSGSGINWFPTGVRPQIVLWVTYVVSLCALAVAAATLLYDQQTSGQIGLIIAGFVAPVMASIAAMPKMIERIRQGKAIRQRVLDTDDNEDNDSSNLPIVSPVTTVNTVYPKSPGNISINSNGTKASMNSDNTRLDGSPREKHIGSNKDMGSPTTLTGGRNLDSELVSNNKCSNPTNRLLTPLVAICGCRPLAVFSSLTSILIYVLLINAAARHCRHIQEAPRRYAVPITAIVPYSDEMERPIHLSIRCKGPIPPTFEQPGNTLPQRATIIIEHMRGYPSLASKSIQNALVQQNHRVCVYDRPGYMLSPQGYVPVPLPAMEKTLFNGLVALGEKVPFYVVGHHSGSEHAELFVKENRANVAGMALIHPTDVSLEALLAINLDSANKTATVKNVLNNDGALMDLISSPSYLNYQRAFASIGMVSTNIPIDVDPNDSGEVAAEWGLSDPNLPQAQYFERLQQPQLVEAISGLDSSNGRDNPLPVILFGLAANEGAIISYLAATSSRFKIETPGLAENQQLALSKVASQISWHISRLF